MERNKEKEGEKRILDSLKRVGVFSAVIAILLVFFSISSLIANIGGNIQNKITGDVIVIKGPGEKYNVTIGSEEIIKELNDNLVCWIDGGINEQDIVVIGNILKDIDCPAAEKKNVKTEMKGNCLVINVDDEVAAELCPEEENLLINIEIVKSPETTEGSFPEDVNVPEKNLYWYILFFFVLIILVLFWREFEFNIKEDLEMKAERAYLRRKASKLTKTENKDEKKKPEEEVIELPAAPLYDEAAYVKRMKEKKKIEEKLEKDSLKKKKEDDAKRNERISKFNNEAEKINDLIIKGDVEESRKRYLALFDVYSDLIPLVGNKNKATLDRMMEYLCNYLGALEKLKGTKRIGFRERIKYNDETIRPTPQILSMDNLNEMKGLIEKKHYEQAKNMFYGANTERIGLKDAVRNITSKKGKDELTEIEARHDKILKKGMINVSEDDFYGFMNDMSELRKELKRRR